MSSPSIPARKPRLRLAALARNETVAGVTMLLATVAAVVLATTQSSLYAKLQTITLGPMDLQHWASSGLLTIFFFVAGLELKRELRVGALRRPSQATIPIAAALCGMVVPAGLYVLVNVLWPGGSLAGWAIPVATDIAFALALLSLAAPSLPGGIRAFLLTWAIVDDVVAISIIAIAFTASLNLLALALALACAAVWWGLQQRRVDQWWCYVALFVACWWLMHESGIHATIAGVLLGLLTRAGPREPHPPAHRWQHGWQPVSAMVAVPIFAFLSAGVNLNPDFVAHIFTSGISAGIVIALVLGKTLGVSVGALLAARLTRSPLPGEMTRAELVAMGLLAGVGFTVALLMTELSFGGDPGVTSVAKAAVLIASLIAAVLAVLALRVTGRRRALSSRGPRDGSRRPSPRPTTPVKERDA